MHQKKRETGEGATVQFHTSNRGTQESLNNIRKPFLGEGVSNSMLRKQWDLEGFRGGWLEILAWLTNKFYGALSKINCTWKKYWNDYSCPQKYGMI